MSKIFPQIAGGCSFDAMARKLDRQQQAELSDFVNALAEAAGYSTTAEWSRDSGYPPPNLSNLRNGRGAVDGYNLLRLLRAAAARSEMTPEQLALGLARATAEDASEESIARRLDELASLVGRALEALEQRSQGEQPAPAARRAPARKKAAR